MPNHTLHFHLSISPEKYLRYYQGTAKNVQVICDDGRTLRFPASAIQKFLSHDGIQGYFEISFDENMKLAGVSRVS